MCLSKKMDTEIPQIMHILRYPDIISHIDAKRLEIIQI